MIEFPFAGLLTRSNTTLAWGLWILVAVAFAAVSWALVYHWRRYGKNSKKVAAMETAYVVGGVGLLAVSFASLLAL